MTPTRTDDFVPLVAAAPSGAAREFQITVIPQNGHAQPFQSLGQKPASVSSVKNAEPQLTMERDGSRITHIRIQCNCGQTHEIACDYEEPAKSSKNVENVENVENAENVEKVERVEAVESVKAKKSTKR